MGNIICVDKASGKLADVILNNSELFNRFERFCKENNIDTNGTVAQILESMNKDQRIKFSEEVKK